MALLLIFLLYFKSLKFSLCLFFLNKNHHSSSSSTHLIILLLHYNPRNFLNRHLSTQNLIKHLHGQILPSSRQAINFHSTSSSANKHRHSSSSYVKFIFFFMIRNPITMALLHQFPKQASIVCKLWYSLICSPSFFSLHILLIGEISNPKPGKQSSSLASHKIDFLAHENVYRSKGELIHTSPLIFSI